MYYEGLVEHWWVGDGDTCPVHKDNYSRDTRNGMEALMCLHHFVPGERHTYINGGVTEQDVCDWVNAPPHRGLTQPIAIPNHLQKTPHSIKTSAAEFRRLGGSSVEFVSKKLDQKDVKAAEFAPMAGCIFVELYLLVLSYEIVHIH